ncbi:hypothetical protein PENTCL1PPCAC_7407, partial [Pristionchus entomophagus]
AKLKSRTGVIFQIIFYGCAKYSYWYYDRMMMQPRVKRNLTDRVEKEKHVRFLKEWIISEMKWHLFCTLLSLIGRNPFVFILNLLMDVFKLWWWYIKRFDDEKNVFDYIFYQSRLNPLCMGLSFLYLFYSVVKLSNQEACEVQLALREFLASIGVNIPIIK